jgi:hypothetical protein
MIEYDNIYVFESHIREVARYGRNANFMVQQSVGVYGGCHRPQASTLTRNPPRLRPKCQKVSIGLLIGTHTLRVSQTCDCQI